MADTDKKPAKRSRWDNPEATPSKDVPKKAKVSEWEDEPSSSSSSTSSTPKKSSRWDATPDGQGGSRWDQTPKGADTSETPTKKGRSRWDETPVAMMGGDTPLGNKGMLTPSAAAKMGFTPEHLQAMRLERELDERNRYLTDEEIDSLLPSEGYKI